MKISNREKILLGILVAVAFLALSYYVILKPQIEKIGMYTLENAMLRSEVQKTKAEIESITLLETMLTELEKSLDEKTVRFYPSIMQDRIIVIVNDLIKKTQLKSKTSAYSTITISALKKNAPIQPKQFPAKDLVEKYISATSEKKQDDVGKTEQKAVVEQSKENNENVASAAEIKSIDVESMSVTLQFEGSYEQATQLIKEIESLERTIVIPNLVLTNGEQNVVTGTINIDFYAMPKIHLQDDVYLDWPYKNKYGKPNPFIK